MTRAVEIRRIAAPFEEREEEKGGRGRKMTECMQPYGEMDGLGATIPQRTSPFTIKER